MTTVRTVIHDRRIDVPAPEDLPDGTEVILTIGTDSVEEDGPMSPDEIARVLAAMKEMRPMEIPDGVAADLDDWERKLNQHGIDHAENGIEEFFSMRRFILDTGIAALHLDRKRGVFERAAAEVAKGNRIGIAAPVLAELAFRAEGSPKRDRNLMRLRQALDVWKLWLIDVPAAFEYGRLAFELKTIGRPTGQNDIMIAAIALSLGRTTVVTMDSDLAAIPGLTVENWAEAI